MYACIIAFPASIVWKLVRKVDKNQMTAKTVVREEEKSYRVINRVERYSSP